MECVVLGKDGKVEGMKEVENLMMRVIVTNDCEIAILFSAAVF